jgi:hypothetical protein
VGVVWRGNREEVDKKLKEMVIDMCRGAYYAPVNRRKLKEMVIDMCRGAYYAPVQ